MALVDVGHQAMGRLPATPIHSPVDRVGLARPAQPRPQRPRPRAAPQRVGQVLHGLPALSLAILAPTGGEQRQRRRVLAMAPMRVQHREVSPPERLVPDRPRAVLQTLHPAAHQGAQQEHGMVVEGRAQHGRHRQDDRPIAPPRMEDLTPLAHPVVDVDFGTPQA